MGSKLGSAEHRLGPVLLHVIAFLMLSVKRLIVRVYITVTGNCEGLLVVSDPRSLGDSVLAPTAAPVLLVWEGAISEQGSVGILQSAGTTQHHEQKAKRQLSVLLGTSPWGGGWDGSRGRAVTF